jgi:hypothetical protein
MSKSLSSLKNRRVNDMSFHSPQVNSCSIPPQQQQRQIDKGLTLQQVIQVVDNRLILLENFMNEHKSSPSPSSENENNEENTNEIGIVINEFEKRFEMLVEEISNLKEIVLNLQAYTMNVNKVLFEEKHPPNPIISNDQMDEINEVEVNEIST